MVFDAAVIGAIGIDTNVYLSGNEVDFSVETSFGENLDCIGQAGGYSSQSFRRLGHKVCFIGYVGKDYFGEHIREVLFDQGIDISMLGIDPHGTKRSVNIMYKNGGRKNFYDGKGSMILEIDTEAVASYLSGTKLAHINIVNWTRDLLRPLKKAGLTLSIDIQDVIDPEDSYREDYVREADVLFFSSTNFGDPSFLIEKYLEIRSDRIVICGLGKKGCIVGNEKRIEHFDPVELTEPVVDTNGAGDSLAAGFLSSYFLEGYSMKEAVLRGQIAARYCCTKKGVSSELITKDHLDLLFEEKSKASEQSS
ncbi:MAG: carbohydrate kinase family protein [Kosmotogaceae bacterium]|nr:carbohydrate kinase family protein [Kosmotogaceae bacterium]